MNAFYSTPNCYTKALHQARKRWPTKVDDFFPYADKMNSYWTGVLKDHLRRIYFRPFKQATSPHDLISST